MNWKRVTEVVVVCEALRNRTITQNHLELLSPASSISVGMTVSET